MLDHAFDLSHDVYPVTEGCFAPKLTLFFLDWLAAILARRALKACRVSRLGGLKCKFTGTTYNLDMGGLKNWGFNFAIFVLSNIL